MDEYIYMRDLDGCPEEKCPLAEYCTHMQCVPAEMRLDPACSNFGKDEKIEDVISYLSGGVDNEENRKRGFWELQDEVRKKYLLNSQALLNAERNIEEALNTRKELRLIEKAWKRAKENTDVAPKLAELGHEWYDLNPMLFRELIQAHYTGSGEFFLNRL